MTPNVHYSRSAERDLEEIAAFTLEKWGEEQAHRYVGGLRRVCRLIAERSMLGRPAVASRPAWRRIEHENHIILYSPNRSGITIQRIFHKSRLLPSVIR